MEETAQITYQKALKLLQDPILPVRAHGLLLLRQLVSSPRSRNAEEASSTVDPALVPAILSIFLQAIQDEDSYIFLNAVKGLAAMADIFGKEVLRGLIADFTNKTIGPHAVTMTQPDLDTKTRIGEALQQVIRRCGSALGLYGKRPAHSCPPSYPRPTRLSSRYNSAASIQRGQVVSNPCRATLVSPVTSGGMREYQLTVTRTIYGRVDSIYG